MYFTNRRAIIASMRIRWIERRRITKRNELVNESEWVRKENQ